LKTAVLAIGGNALIKESQIGTIEEQFTVAKETCTHITGMIEEGWNIALTHGNGPQIGHILRRVELSSPEVYPLPLDVCGAESQGLIGYILQQTLTSCMVTCACPPKKIVTVLTQVIVDENDPAFENPSKPIGSHYDKETALELMERENWVMKEDARGTWRRVVASPEPLEIVEIDIIKKLVEDKDGVITICVGGGGIPVTRDKETSLLRGVDHAVIDKDLATGLLAQKLGVDLFLIATNVEKVALHFGKPNQQWLDSMTVDEAKKYLAEGHFLPGSMAPKITAAIHYLIAGGKEVIITSVEKIGDAIKGKTGTKISL
jgi:carbamate kinase